MSDLSDRLRGCFRPQFERATGETDADMVARHHTKNAPQWDLSRFPQFLPDGVGTFVHIATVACDAGGEGTCDGPFRTIAVRYGSRIEYRRMGMAYVV